MYQEAYEPRYTIYSIADFVHKQLLCQLAGIILTESENWYCDCQDIRFKIREFTLKCEGFNDLSNQKEAFLPKSYPVDQAGPRAQRRECLREWSGGEGKGGRGGKGREGQQRLVNL